MLPFLNQKIWFAFQGLPIENVDGVFKLPWPKCLVLTNNLMYILKLDSLTVEFRKKVPKAKAELMNGLSFEEYNEFLNEFLHTHLTSITEKANSEGEDVNDELRDRKGSNSLEGMMCPEEQLKVTNRPRLNTMNNKNQNVHKGYTTSLSNDEIVRIQNSLDDYCWTLYRTKMLSGVLSSTKLQKSVFKLWNLFIKYSLKHDNGVPEIPVTMDELEARYWCGCIREQLGERRQLLMEDLDITEEINRLTFPEFFVIIEDVIKEIKVTDQMLEYAIDIVCDEAVSGVIMKGSVKIDGKYQRFCKLKERELFIYNHKTGPLNLRQTFILEPLTQMECGLNKIHLRSSSHPITVTMDISDTHQFNKWRSGLQNVLNNIYNRETNPYVYAAFERTEVRKRKRNEIKAKRMSVEQKIDEERKARSKVAEVLEQKLSEVDKERKHFQAQIMKEQEEKEKLLKKTEEIKQEKEAHIASIISEQQELYKRQLEHLQSIEMEKNELDQQLKATQEEKFQEENKRSQLQMKHNEAQDLLKEAEEKIFSLQKLGEQLEKALEEERQAKEDESAVREATLNLLQEETEAKQKLQNMLSQQSGIIDLEIQKRNEFAEALEQEKIRIKTIESEKEKLSSQLEMIQERTKTSGLKVRRLDNKVSKLAETIFSNTDHNAPPVSHRGAGFIAQLMVETKLSEESITSSTLLTNENVSEKDQVNQKNDN